MTDLQRTALPLVLVTFVVLALGYSVAFPLGEAPDEVSHWGYVQYVATHWELPLPEGMALGEVHQPPLYYFLGAVATAWIPQSEYAPLANPDFAFDQPQTPNLLLHTRSESFPYHGVPLAWHLFRLVSVAMGAVTVWATWRIASEFFPSEQQLALGAAVFVAFLPSFITLSAAVNNDNLVIMLSCLTILQTVWITHHPPQKRDDVVLGMLLGLALLTKLNALVLWVFVVLILGFRAYVTRNLKNTAVSFALCLGVATAIVLPWAIYNVSKYGDPFGWSLYLAVGTVRPTPMTVQDWLATLPELVTSFWGRPGGILNIRFPSGVYNVLSVVGIISLAGWIKILRPPSDQDFSDRALRLLVFVATFWVPLIVAYFQWASNDYAADQARRLFPGLPFLAVMLAAGLVQLFSSYKRFVIAVWSVGFFALAFSMLIYVKVIYDPPSQDLRALTPLNGTNVPADFGATLRVVDYRIDKMRAAPGDALHVQVYWQALQDPIEDYWLLLRLVGNGDSVANQDGTPAAGRVTTDHWKKGQLFSSQHTLTIPGDVAPGIYSLELGLHPFGRWEWLPVRGQDMLKLGQVTITP